MENNEVIELIIDNMFSSAATNVHLWGLPLKGDVRWGLGAYFGGMFWV